jgi:hypothetical protein
VGQTVAYVKLELFLGRSGTVPQYHTGYRWFGVRFVVPRVEPTPSDWQAIAMLMVLVGSCIAARNGGADVPTVWATVSRSHSLVNGIRSQAINDGRIQLEIHLITGHRLIHDSEALGYSLVPFPPC